MFSEVLAEPFSGPTRSRLSASDLAELRGSDDRTGDEGLDPEPGSHGKLLVVEVLSRFKSCIPFSLLPYSTVR